MTRAVAAPRDAERALLAQSYMDPRSVDIAREAGLKVDDLIDERHRIIWPAICARRDRDEPIDPITLQEELGRSLERAGGAAYLSRLLDGVPQVSGDRAADHVTSWARDIRKQARRRRAARAAEKLRLAALSGGAVEPALIEIDEIARESDDAVGLATPVELADLLRLEMPPRPWIIGGLLQERDMAMVHAFRGVGKSRIVHGLAIALSGGTPFLRWRVNEPRGVLLVDGELPREDLQLMLSQAVAAAGELDACDAPLGCASAHQPPGRAPLQVLSADLGGGVMRSLATPAGRRHVEAHLDGVSLLILDSITTLCPGLGPENDAESWEEMQSWLLKLRAKGVAVLLVHHEGKGGRQRGTSKREDVLSTVVQLRRPHDYRPEQGCRVEVHYTKARGLTGDDASSFEAMLRPGRENAPVWTWRPLEDAQRERLLEMETAGMTQREIATELGMDQSTVSRKLKRAHAVQVESESPADASTRTLGVHQRI